MAMTPGAPVMKCLVEAAPNTDVPVRTVEDVDGIAVGRGERMPFLTALDADGEAYIAQRDARDSAFVAAHAASLLRGSIRGSRSATVRGLLRHLLDAKYEVYGFNNADRVFQWLADKSTPAAFRVRKKVDEGAYYVLNPGMFAEDGSPKDCVVVLHGIERDERMILVRTEMKGAGQKGFEFRKLADLVDGSAKEAKDARYLAYEAIMERMHDPAFVMYVVPDMNTAVQWASEKFVNDYV